MADVWYQDGLQFACTQCGNCCTGAPGFVWIDDQEIDEIAAALGDSREAFVAVYTRKYGNRVSLRERNNGDCLLYDREKGCTVYAVRPKQCRTWPFWDSNLKTKTDWNETAAGCPGCNQGDLIPVDEITRRLKVIRI